MSSILKALKKIEKLTPRPEDSPAWPQPIDTKKAVGSRVKKAWLYHKVLSTGAVFLVIAVIGWFVLAQREAIIATFFPQTSKPAARQQEPSEQSKTNVHEAKIKKAPPKSEPPAPPRSALPAPSPAAGSSKKEPIASSKSRSSAPSKPARTPSTTQPPAAGLAAAQKTGPSTANEPTNPSNPLTAASASPDAPGSPARSDAAIAQKPKNSAAAADSLSSLPRMTQAELKLQAIAWSQQASQRLAVINNRIVREGESVDGYAVTQIRADDVIVSDGTESWRLEFSLAP